MPYTDYASWCETAAQNCLIGAIFERKSLPRRGCRAAVVARDCSPLLYRFTLAIAAMYRAQAADALYEGFRNPGDQYRPMPVWYWNAEIRGNEAKRQIDRYLAQGAQGAIVYPDIGLRTPFLSEAWWTVWAEILPYARQRNFKLGWVPEFNDPDGDARDPWMDPPDQSRVLAGHPEFRLKRLAYIERHFSGPGSGAFRPPPRSGDRGRRPQHRAGRPGRGHPCGPLSLNPRSSPFEADLGPGDWLLAFITSSPARAIRASRAWIRSTATRPSAISTSLSANSIDALRSTSDLP